MRFQDLIHSNKLTVIGVDDAVIDAVSGDEAVDVVLGEPHVTVSGGVEGARDAGSDTNTSKHQIGA
jgi:hypothetical protein